MKQFEVIKDEDLEVIDANGGASVIGGIVGGSIGSTGGSIASSIVGLEKFLNL